MNINRGDILLVDMGEENKVGSEQIGIRPACVISNNVGNQNSTTIIVALLTSKEKKTKDKKTYPMHAHIKRSDIIGYLEEDSIILCEQLYTVDKARIIKKKGHIDPNSPVIKSLDRAIKISLGIPVKP